jgi:hypothetical protein
MCGCGCGGLAGLIIPRLMLLGMWLFTPFVRLAFGGPILPFLGLLFLPLTTMAYAFMKGSGQMSLVGWLLVGGAVVLDLGIAGGAGWSNRDQIPGYKKKGFDNP